MVRRKERSCFDKSIHRSMRDSPLGARASRPPLVLVDPFSTTTDSFAFTLNAGEGARAPSKSLELCFALFDKRGVCFFKIRMLHAQGLRDSFGFERRFESHVHFPIEHLFSFR